MRFAPKAAGIPACMKSLRNALVLTFTAALAACGGGNVAGNGNKPDHIVIEMVQNRSLVLTPGKIYQCQLAQMRAYMFFTDGSAGDFTNRVTWSVDASGAGDTKISNGDLPVNPQDVTEGTYGIGVMVPGNTGHSSVLATYQGLVGRFDLTVLPSDPATYSFVDGTDLINTSLDPANAFQSNYLKAPVVQPDTGTLWLGTGTTYPMMVLAPLNGVETDVSGFARWDFVNGGDANELSVTAFGTLSANRAGGAQTLRARFPGCSTELTLPVAVSDIKGISIKLNPLFFDTTNQKFQSLLLGNSERVGVLADLGKDDQGHDIPQQDVSGSVSFWISDPSLASVTQQAGGAAYLLAGAAGTFNMQATGNFGNQAQIQSSIMQASTTSGNLKSIAVTVPSSDALAGMPAACQLGTPTNPVLQSGSICYSPFTATGTYVLQDGSTIEQDVTHYATWSLSDPTLASIAGGVPYGGSVTAATPSSVPAGQSIETITATIPGDTTNSTATSQVTIQGAS